MISWHGSRSSVLLKRTRRSRAIYSPHPFTVKKLCSLHPLKVKVQKTTWKKTAGKHSGQLCLTGPEIFGSDLQTSKHTEWMCFYNPKDLDWVKMTSLVEVCFVYTVPFMKQNVVNISHVNLKALKWRVLVFFLFNKKRAGPCSQRWSLSWEVGSLGRSYSISIQIFIFYYFHQNKTKVKTHISATAGVKYSIGPIAYTALNTSTCGFIPIGESDRTYECL